MSYPFIEGLDVENDIPNIVGEQYYEILGERVQEKYSNNPYAFFSDIESLISRYGQEVADEAVQNLTGDTASEFLSRFADRPGYFDTNDVFNDCLGEITYMCRNYGMEKCREELVEAELWFYDQGNDSIKSAMNDVITIWTGADGLIAFINEVIEQNSY